MSKRWGNRDKNVQVNHTVAITRYEYWDPKILERYAKRAERNDEIFFAIDAPTENPQPGWGVVWGGKELPGRFPTNVQAFLHRKALEEKNRDATDAGPVAEPVQGA